VLNQEVRTDAETRKRELVEDAVKHVWRHGVSVASTRQAEGPVAVTANGVWIEDIDGNKYLDALSGGSAAATLGHGREDVADAIAAQAKRLHWVSLRTFVNEPSVALARKIAEITPGDLTTSFFVSSGSETVESATQMARSYHRQKGNPQKVKFIYRKTGYHGTTMVGASSSSSAEFREWFAPLAPGFVEVDTAYSYRRPQGMTLEEYGKQCAREIEDTILREGPETVAGILAEAIPAALVLPPPPGYLERLREICDRYDILWIDDEVFIGVGRTGAYFACEHYGVQPDIITSSKGLTGGYVPLGAAVASRRIMDVLIGDGGGDQAKVAGHTYSAHPTACAAGLAVLEAIDREGLVENARVQGDFMLSEFEKFGRETENVGDIRGRGFLIGIELVADIDTREPFAKELQVGKRVTQVAMRDGLMVRATGDVITLFPALIASRSEVEEMVERTQRAITEVVSELP
jgi:putrescine---pyruvate transaminase